MSADLRARFDSALEHFMSAATADLRATADELAPMADEARAFVLDSGKRLRPSFCFLGALAAGAEDCDALAAAAASLELLQACALVHDDVIDHSDTRRGRPAVHRRFAELHRTSGWSGDPSAFGAAAAILLGDVLLSWSEAMLSTSGLDEAALRRAHPISAAMRTEVMAGQYLDVVEQARGETTVERALRVARLKSAKYTIERPLHLGAAIAGASQEASAIYTGFGIPLGEAFQLRDDLLGVFGDPAATGKPAGDDLREGKQTVLVALAIERSSAVDARRIRDALGEPDLSDDEVATMRDLITGSGAEAEVERMIAERFERAVAALDRLPERSGQTDAACEQLVALAEVAVGYRRG
ncbi:MAG TPA: polyprenyl synthetase family protein [Mycobacteriales bacterium]|nr:polyprenyl synthetase family protein [Mycobacteriales bacterium]